MDAGGIDSGGTDAVSDVVPPGSQEERGIAK